tara:strand:+ start:632 stop:763 length:132 start_codon:yes stop_codon:yes gene_type:complete
MIKNIAIILVFVCLIISCGKKGDPKYENSKRNSEIQNILIKKV